jgi:D-3-phosphoglycerate dehydrogenase
MSRNPPRVVIIGDTYVPSNSIGAAVRAKFGSKAFEIIERDWEIPGGGPEIHAVQHQIEMHGPDAVDVPRDLVELATSAEVLIVHFFPVRSEVLIDGRALRAVIVARAGTENIDPGAAQRHNVTVHNIAGRNAPAVAELTLGLILAEVRNIARADRSIASGGWQKEFRSRSGELGGLTVGLIGYGQVARSFVRLLSGFGVSIVASDPFSGDDSMRLDGVSPLSFSEVFAIADIVAVFARLTEDNRGFIGQEQFALMKPTAYFVNTARSRLVDYGALLETLREGRIAGAALDVFDEEPLPVESPWRSLDNVTLTTHFAGDTPESFARSGKLVADVLARIVPKEVRCS